MTTIKNIEVSYAMQPHVLKICNATIEGPTYYPDYRAQWQVNQHY